ncbi:hypothetical protein K2173_016114 [Erythroxylum novogranatense]|uniref:C2 NT-type domain-containing protein n=1 Tax=Erythroxylum novogranatense TaxID=1862640 RepID=A0AAV8SG09_9ROSI|nr:hypothetical protein K2173_016114 [Erythroxylum novogranatense]
MSENMMFSKAESRKRVGGEDSGSQKLLKEIESISKALYLDKNPSRRPLPLPSNRPVLTGKTQLVDSKAKQRYGEEDALRKDKKSIWNWKPLKAFSRSRKFNCCFTLQVHSIEGLPARFDGASVCVHWKRRDGELVTRPVKVSEGIVEFEDKLLHTCAVHGSRSGPHHSAKYDAKHFLLYASVFGAPELDLGKHRVDLTRLLPLTLEELEEEKSSGNWTTSFRLSGEAKGAVMNVSFGYVVIEDGPVPSGKDQNVPQLLNLKQHSARVVKPVSTFRQHDGKSTLHNTGSLPSTLRKHLHSSSRSVEDVKDLHEVLPITRSELSIPVTSPPEKFDEDKLDSPVDFKSDVAVTAEHHHPIKPSSYPDCEPSQKSVEEGCKETDCSAIDKKIEGMESGKLEEVTMNASNLSPAEVTNDDVDFEEGSKIHLHDVESGKLEEVTMNASKLSPAEVTNDDVDFEEGSKIHRHDVENHGDDSQLVVHDCDIKGDVLFSKEILMKELESALSKVSKLESEMLDSSEETENCMELKADDIKNRSGRSLSLDHLTESVATEFLEMLGIEHSSIGLSSESEAESPREQLLKQFERDALDSGYSLFDFNLSNEGQGDVEYNEPSISIGGNLSTEFLEPSLDQSADECLMGTQSTSGKGKAKMLEDLETEALMREWGLNDEAFQCSPPKISDGFGSPIDLPPEEPLELPPLGEGLGPFLQTKDGGFLRSMNPSLFKKAKAGGSLIMQVSNPVVVPAAMGSGITDVLEHLASVGIEKLSMQANKLMPLEDITGKTMQQVAWEASTTLEEPERQSLLQHELEIAEDVSGGQKSTKARSSAARPNKMSSNPVGKRMDSEYVSLEDLAPLAMDKVELLSMEGLRIQSGMMDENTPSNINAQPMGEISALQGKNIDISGSLGLEGTAGLQLLDIKDGADDVDGLMGLSLTLGEWMRLDSGDLGDEDQISEKTSKILAAHHANSLDSIRGGSKGDRRRGKGCGKKCGLLGNNFTVALMVQLRDPLRNYEPVGTPMLALVQVERVFVPPKPKVYRNVSEVRNSNEEDDECESLVEVQKQTREEKALDEEGTPQFQITEVRVAGLKTETGKKVWGTTNQQQSGSRWLLANGMGKSNKLPFAKTNAAAASKSSTSLIAKVQPRDSLTAKVQTRDSLWSISSRARGTGSKWK